MGDVFRGVHELLRRPVALKRIHRYKTRGEAARRRLLFEAQTVARLNHPSIIQIYDFLEYEDDLWIVMELVKGQSLRRRLRRPMNRREAVEIALPITEALAASHRMGILHRDLKPENVFLVKGGGVKLLDFGLAKDFRHSNPPDGPITTVGEILGTPRSMSPEQALGETLDPRSDLFSLGVLLYECLCGTSPFQGPTLVSTLRNVCLHKHRPVQDLVPGIPDELCRLVDDLLKKDPALRPPDADAVAVRLSALVAADDVDYRYG